MLTSVLSAFFDVLFSYGNPWALATPNPRHPPLCPGISSVPFFVYPGIAKPGGMGCVAGSWEVGSLTWGGEGEVALGSPGHVDRQPDSRMRTLLLPRLPSAPLTGECRLLPLRLWALLGL